jgi:hypothetical protein
MARSVLPRATAREAWLLTGHTESMPECDGRQEPLNFDEDLEVDVSEGGVI